MRDEAAIEQEIQDKGLNAPRLTPQLIDEQIVHEVYFNAAEAAFIFHPDFPRAGPLPAGAETLTCLTICVLVLKNGFTVVGKSACASPANYDEALGRKISREDARNQIWSLEGYHLRHKLVNGQSEPKV